MVIEIPFIKECVGLNYSRGVIPYEEGYVGDYGIDMKDSYIIAERLYSASKQDKQAVDDGFDLVDSEMHVKLPEKKEIKTDNEYEEVFVIAVQAGMMLRELASKLDKITRVNGSGKLHFHLQRITNFSPDMNDASIALLAATALTDTLNFDIQFRNEREEAACINNLLCKIMGRLRYTPEWWHKFMYGVKPYYQSKLNDAVSILVTAMSCISDTDYVEIGGNRYAVPPTEKHAYDSVY